MIYVPRYARKKSLTNVYHIILRGINQQDIFLESQDYNKFLKDLKETKEKYGYQIYAYVLMTNHIHLIIYDKNDIFSKAIQSLAIRYSYYFNKKYLRNGHLFQNRFLSKEIDTESYLLNLQRYIHQNPFKEGLSKIEDYKWSSYQEYMQKAQIVDTELILSLFSNDRNRAIELFSNFNHFMMESNSLEYELKNFYTDEEAIKIIKQILREENLMMIQKYNRKIQKEKIEKILEVNGITATQIARILGLNKRTVQRYKEKMCPKEDKVSF